MKSLKISIPYLSGTWKAPASKSELIRRIAIAMLCEQTSLFSNVTWCNDSLAMLNIADAWGADITLANETIEIKGSRLPMSQQYHAGESALCMRLMIPILAQYRQHFVLSVEGTLLHRPIGDIERIIKQLGAQIQTNNHFPPIEILGGIKPADIRIEYAISSQHISGLLMTLPLLNANSSLRLNRLISLPYIRLTLQMLSEAGINIETNYTFTEYYIAGNQIFKPVSASIEGDWSAAAMFIAASAIYGDLYLKNLNLQSLQADKDILQYVNISSNKVGTQTIKPVRADITHCPDLFPALMILALHASGKSEIHGINRLLHKESNRLDTFIQEFSKFGARFNIEGDKLIVRPPLKIESCEINPHYDHRLAMASALAVTGTNASVIIHHANCVNKSYPSFWEDLTCLGAKYEYT